MNFIDLTVSRDGGVVIVKGDGSTMQPDDGQAALLRDSGLDAVTVGFRPEHLDIGALTGPGLNVTVTIDVIEFLGNDVLIHGSSGGRDVVRDRRRRQHPEGPVTRWSSRLRRGACTSSTPCRSRA